MTHWHYAMLEMVLRDHLVRPMISQEEQTREEAHAAIQGLLDREPAAATIAKLWRRGAKDDVVFMGPFQFTIFECTGADCREGWQAFIDDHAATLRSVGMRDVGVARITEIR